MITVIISMENLPQAICLVSCFVKNLRLRKFLFQTEVSIFVICGQNPLYSLLFDESRSCYMNLVLHCYYIRILVSGTTQMYCLTQLGTIVIGPLFSIADRVFDRWMYTIGYHKTMGFDVRLFVPWYLPLLGWAFIPCRQYGFLYHNSVRVGGQRYYLVVISICGPPILLDGYVRFCL